MQLHLPEAQIKESIPYLLEHLTVFYYKAFKGIRHQDWIRSISAGYEFLDVICSLKFN